MSSKCSSLPTTPCSKSSPPRFSSYQHILSNIYDLIQIDYRWFLYCRRKPATSVRFIRKSHLSRFGDWRRKLAHALAWPRYTLLCVCDSFWHRSYVYKPSNSSAGSCIVASRVFRNKLFHILFCILVNVRNQKSRRFCKYILIFKKQLPTNKNKSTGTILVVPISNLKATNSTCTWREEPTSPL